MKEPVYYERRLEDDFIGPICNHPFPIHLHDVVEIVCMTEGTDLELTIAGTLIQMEPGDIVVVFPSTPHSYETVAEDTKGLSLIFNAETIPEFTHAFRSMLPVSPLIRRDSKPEALDRIIAILVDLTSQPERSPLLGGYLHLFLSYLFSCLALQPVTRQLETTLPFQVLHYIAEHYTEPLSLDSVAHTLGISRIHLSHVCSQQLRINFRQHINALRVNQACTLLQNPGLSISQVAYACGYNNLRTFHRAFQGLCGLSPGQFRQERLPSSAGDEKSAD